MARAKMKGVPKDELVLAEVLANAEAWGVKHTTLSPGVDKKTGRPIDNSVCVVGAYFLGKPIRRPFQYFDDAFEGLTGLEYEDTYRGNDYDGPDWHPESDDGDRGQTLGYAFRVAMTEI